MSPKNDCVMHPQTMKLDLRAQVDVTIRGMFQRGNVVVSHPEQGHSR